MAQLAIRCLPRVPVDTDDIELWLQRELQMVRGSLPGGIVRLSRLTQTLPTTEINVGWLFELEVNDDDERLSLAERITPLLTDLRLLGLQPALMSAEPKPG
jgi:hypothetical protein